QTTFLSKQGQWPLYQSLYAGKGHLMGWLTVNTNEPESDLSGLLSWIKLPQPLAKLYPAGFEFPNGIEAVGSLFSFTNGVPALNWTRGELFLEGGNLTQSLTNSVQIDPNLKVSSTNKVSLTITNSSGWFQGRVVDPATGKPIVVNGTLLQKQNTGYGYFLGTNSSGRVYLGPQ
ncbi:MAG TPA: hypothetical protein VNZ22_04135, partial [Bacillota bacterium]|nr:hypothetical protein [Bacillota bacterium]